MHVTDGLRRDVAKQLNGYFWEANETQLSPRRTTPGDPRGGTAGENGADAGTRIPNLPPTRLPIHVDHGFYQRIQCLW
jgi:hypothetical protein